MQKLSIFAVLVAIMAFGAMFLAQNATAGAPPPKAEVTLSAATTGTDSCTVDAAKCTLNKGDDVEITLTITGETEAAIPYGNWAATVNHAGLDFVSASITCAGTNGSSAAALDCNGLSEDVNSSTQLAVVTLDCTTAGTNTVSVKNISGLGNTNAGSSIDINCNESASMSLERKDTEKPYVKDQVTVAVAINDLKLKDADGDGTAGYNAFQAILDWDILELTLVDVTFKTDLGITATAPDVATATTSGSILLGASIKPIGDEESTIEGNVVNLTFAVLERAADLGTASVDLLAGGEIITEKGTVLVQAGDSVKVSPSAALFSLSFDSGCKNSDPNTCRVPAGDDVTINVDVSNLGVPADTVKARVRWGLVAGLTFVSGTFPSDPPCDPLNQAFTLHGAPTNETRFSCSNDTPTQADTPSTFQVTLTCNDPGGSEVSHTVQLLSAGSLTTVTTTDSGTLPVNLGKDLAIVCVGSTTDADGDGCNVTEETGLGLDPNVFDYPDATKDGHVLIQDVLAYVLAFDPIGPIPTATNPRDVSNPPDGAIAEDIIIAVLLFGTNCKA